MCSPPLLFLEKMHIMRLLAHLMETPILQKMQMCRGCNLSANKVSVVVLNGNYMTIIFDLYFCGTTILSPAKVSSFFKMQSFISIS